MLGGAATAATGDPLRGSNRDDVLRGTRGADVLLGRGGDDRLYGYRGRDRLEGGSGHDLLVGGPGADVLVGGTGADRIQARDGERDVVFCGKGIDVAFVNRGDRVRSGCERVALPRPPPPPPPPSGERVIRVDEAWTCRGPVDLDLLKVTMRTTQSDAAYLRTNCTGRIRRIEIETWTGDGLKVNVPTPAAHDLVVEGGYIRCFAHGPAGHQDGVQAMGGERITFRKLEINCNSNPNAQFYVSGMDEEPSSSWPEEVVCESCFLGRGAASTLFIDKSLRSGARNTLVCPGRFHDIRVERVAQSPVNQQNKVLPRTDRRCRG